MKLIQATKQTGAKRLHRRYLLENYDNFGIFDEHNVGNGLVEFPIEMEEDFLNAVEIFREKQKAKLTKELRKVQVPKVTDATQEQGTKEWLQARAGIITASNTPFTIKGLKIPTYDTYVDKKVAEKFLLENGVEKEDTYNSRTTELGHILEPKAIEEYERVTGNKVISKGLVVGTDSLIGASTDGITSDKDFNKINIEIKSVFLSTYLSELTRREMVKKYYGQMQIQMYVLDIDLTHFLVQSQETDLVPLIIREVKRDEEFISNAIETLKCFEADFAERYEMLKQTIV